MFLKNVSSKLNISQPYIKNTWSCYTDKPDLDNAQAAVICNSCQKSHLFNFPSSEMCSLSQFLMETNEGNDLP